MRSDNDPDIAAQNSQKPSTWSDDVRCNSILWSKLLAFRGPWGWRQDFAYHPFRLAAFNPAGTCGPRNCYPACVDSPLACSISPSSCQAEPAELGRLASAEEASCMVLCVLLLSGTVVSKVRPSGDLEGPRTAF